MEFRPARVLTVTVTAVLTAAVIAACGGGSSTPTTSTPSAASAGTGVAPAGPGGPDSTAFTARRAALSACLKKYGVTLPTPRFVGPRPGVTGSTGTFRRFGSTGATGVAGAQRRRFFGATGGAGTPGGGVVPGGGFGPGGSAFRNPKFAAAIAKCGGFGGGFGGRFGATGETGAQGFPATSTTAYRASIVRYAACMKTNGVTLPKPNFTGVGFVFGTKVNRTTSAFIAANSKCEGLVAAAPAG
jgi:hypothetical protein